MSSDLTRREFLSGAAAAAATFTIVPRHVLGGPGIVAPSDKITLACVGFGTQAIREIGGILASPDVQVVSVCDVEQGRRRLPGVGEEPGPRRHPPAHREPDLARRVSTSVPGGREVGKEIVEAYYAKQRGTGTFKGCSTYVDFRELLEKEKDVTAVKVMTPDHTHAPIALAALKKGMNVIVHKPLANRVLEARAVVEMARRRRSRRTSCPPAREPVRRRRSRWSGTAPSARCARSTTGRCGRCGRSSRRGRPATRRPVPAGFDWTLWLGPSLDRPYHPNYTHTNFRGWYEFGGGSIADMGHYSLWPIFQLLSLDAPVSVESTPSHECTVVGTCASGSRTTTRSRRRARSACVSRPRATVPGWTSSGTTAASGRPCPRS